MPTVRAHPNPTDVIITQHGTRVLLFHPTLGIPHLWAALRGRSDTGHSETGHSDLGHHEAAPALHLPPHPSSAGHFGQGNGRTIRLLGCAGAESFISHGRRLCTSYRPAPLLCPRVRFGLLFGLLL